jgi:multicomponent Na+:H+ antiporter subunit G
LNVASVIAGVFALIGAALVFVAGIGVLRFPDVYARMHAATKVPTLGIALIAAAAAIELDGDRGKVVMAAIVILITAPSAAHFIGRAAYRVEGVEIVLEGGDDLEAYLAEHDGNADRS